MILDRIDNVGAYRGLGPNIAAAIDFLRTADFRAMAPGRHEVDGERLYVMIVRGPTRPLEEITWESHRKYIDLQYVIDGRERMGWASLRDVDAVTRPYDAADDAALYKASGSLFEVRAGMFAVFGPQDVHAPSLAAEAGPSPVLKAVLKIRVEPACRDD